MTLAPRHREWFESAGISPEFAEQQGCFTAETVDDLPEDYRRGLGRAVPGIVLPWKAGDGTVSPQLRPDDRGVDDAGEPGPKYRFQKDARPVLWALRPEGSKILIVEGSKQAMLAALTAPLEFAVYGIAGCTAWSKNQMPIADLKVARGKEVVVGFDADASTNPNVYQAGLKFHAALEVEGADKIGWLRLPAGGSNGLDDLLMTRAPEDRLAYLASLIALAKPKIADKMPKGKKKAMVAAPGRPFLDVDEDRLLVINKLTSYLVKKWDRKQLFSHGGVLSEFLDGDSPMMRPLVMATFQYRVQQVCSPVHLMADGSAQFTWPDPGSMNTSLALSDRYTPLNQLVRMPFIREDGSVCQIEGYDESTKTLLVLDDLKGIDVPNVPTADDVRGAVKLLLSEWLGDMPFAPDGSQANALALILTPFIRTTVPITPLAVIDGLQMSVGKNLLADCLSILVLGRSSNPRPFTEDDNENRKALLPIFSSGTPICFFDEAHEIHGANFARAITAPYYSDRVLGVSKTPEYLNQLTMVAMGNQVQVNGDLARRVYRIGLHPTGENPQDRNAASYAHPDLRGWTLEHRAELVGACLTLIRHWCAQGMPRTQRDFGSFEEWQSKIGGILESAGVPGFLENRKEWRSESDYDSNYWLEHLQWLDLQFGGQPFLVAQVRERAVHDGKNYPPPPGRGLEKPTTEGYSRELGKAYGKRKDRWMDGYRLRRSEKLVHTTVREWWVERREPSEALGGIPPTPSPKETPPVVKDVSMLVEAEPIPADPSVTSVPIVFDLETCSADDLYKRHDFIRLGGSSVDGEHVTFHDGSDGWEVLLESIENSPEVIGHNIMGFDLQALARSNKLDVRKLAMNEQVYDTLLAARFLDPPMAKEKGIDFTRLHNLDFLGKKYELGAKSADLKALAKEHGGFDMIPIDDPTYREYLANDVTLNWRLYKYLKAQIPDETYLRREHKVAALAAQFSLNGFRVDTDLIDERYRDGERIRRKALVFLNRKYGCPLDDEKGVRYAAPLSTKAGKAWLVQALESRGVQNYWTTGKTEDIATGRESMQQIALQHMDKPEVVEICKLVIAVVTTRTVYKTVLDAMIGDRVHPVINMKQSTGRWSLTKPGLTVMGKRGGKWREREVFVAEPGHVIIACDLSQIDMRAVAGLSQDPAYMDMLSHEDPHAEIARILFGDPGMRELAKPIGHGWNYGRGIKAISESNDIAPEIVKKFDEETRARFPRLVEWQGEVRAIAESGELLDNGFGRRMRPDPSRAHTQGPALMGQGAARDLMMESLLRLPEECWPMLRAQVHDEVVLSVPAGDAVDVQNAVLEAMTFEWKGVPIKGDGGPTDRTSWGQVYAK